MTVLETGHAFAVVHQVNWKIFKNIALGLSNTYTEVSRTFKGDLGNSPHVALVGRETPDG